MVNVLRCPTDKSFIPLICWSAGMKTVWVGKIENSNLKSPLRNLMYRLLVDVIPVILLLAAMACGMAFVANKMTEPRSVELQAVSEKLG